MKETDINPSRYKVVGPISSGDLWSALLWTKELNRLSEVRAKGHKYVVGAIFRGKDVPDYIPNILAPGAEVGIYLKVPQRGIL
jgi:hypothetical protein